MDKDSQVLHLGKISFSRYYGRKKTKEDSMSFSSDDSIDKKPSLRKVPSSLKANSALFVSLGVLVVHEIQMTRRGPRYPSMNKDHGKKLTNPFSCSFLKERRKGNICNHQYVHIILSKVSYNVQLLILPKNQVYQMRNLERC